jgi:hypothetical protein
MIDPADIFGDIDASVLADGGQDALPAPARWLAAGCYPKPLLGTISVASVIESCSATTIDLTIAGAHPPREDLGGKLRDNLRIEQERTIALSRRTTHHPISNRDQASFNPSLAFAHAGQQKPWEVIDGD